MNFKINKLNKSSNDIEFLKKNPQLFNKFLESNKGFIEKIILQYINHAHTEYNDVMQVARIGLWKALHTFNPRKYNNTFSTFAYIAIKNDVLQYLKKHYQYYKHIVSNDIMNNNIATNKNNDVLRYINWNTIRHASLYNNFEDTMLTKISLTQSLNKLTTMEKEIFTLKSQGYTFQEIANKYNKKIGVIKNIYYNATHKLQYICNDIK